MVFLIVSLFHLKDQSFLKLCQESVKQRQDRCTLTMGSVLLTDR